jgi:hypothetical protein
MATTREALDLAITDLVDLEAEALQSWREYRARIAEARRQVAALQVEQLREQLRAPRAAGAA